MREDLEGLYGGGVEPDSPARRAALLATYRRSRLFSSVFLLSPAGEILWEEPAGGHRDDRLIAMPAAREAIATGRRAASALTTLPNGARRLFLFVPLVDLDGKTTGIAGASLDPARPVFASLLPAATGRRGSGDRPRRRCGRGRRDDGHGAGGETSRRARFPPSPPARPAAVRRPRPGRRRRVRAPPPLPLGRRRARTGGRGLRARVRVPAADARPDARLSRARGVLHVGRGAQRAAAAPRPHAGRRAHHERRPRAAHSSAAGRRGRPARPLPRDDARPARRLARRDPDARTSSSKRRVAARTQELQRLYAELRDRDERRAELAQALPQRAGARAHAHRARAARRDLPDDRGPVPSPRERARRAARRRDARAPRGGQGPRGTRPRRPPPRHLRPAPVDPRRPRPPGRRPLVRCAAPRAARYRRAMRVRGRRGPRCPGTSRPPSSASCRRPSSTSPATRRPRTSSCRSAPGRSGSSSRSRTTARGSTRRASQLPSETGRGLGLLGMRERVEILGGTMSLDSAPGEGTHITLEIPIPKEVLHA